MKEEILNIMHSIVEKELHKEVPSLQNATYNDQKVLISSLFGSTLQYSKGTIMLRLVVIDSLYSTNAAYSYFSFEEMADKIYALGPTSDAAEQYFYNLVLGGKDTNNLFTEPYGIQKNLSEGSKQMSLLSKYAYYCLYKKKQYPLGFPIYDSLALESYPTICKMLQITPMRNIDNDITNYIEALDNVRARLFDDRKDLVFGDLQQFDILDAYLWRMGKFSGGNLSLLLNRDEYVTFVKNLGLQALAINDKENTFKEADDDYKTRMMIELGITNKKEFKFNDIIVKKLQGENTNPFAGIESSNYMNELLCHWTKFMEYQGKNVKSKEYMGKDAEMCWADYNEYRIVQYSSGKIQTWKSGVAYKNVKESLRNIASLIGFAYDPKWNTQQFGAKLIAHIKIN